MASLVVTVLLPDTPDVDSKTIVLRPTYTTPAQLLWMILQNDLGNWIMPDTAVTNRLMIMRHR